MSPENSGGTARKQRGRPFQKGQSGNPGGRPKSSVDFVELCRSEGSPRAYACLMAEIDSGGEQRIKAAELILAYAHGKPTQALEHSGPDGEPLQVVIQKISPEAA